MTVPAIRTERLVRDFKSIRAVDDVTFEVPPGIVFGFLGPNGAGKTTMIRLLLGLLQPTGGAASVLGHDVRTQSGRIRERTGALLEHTGLYERLSAEQNLDFYARVWGLGSGERKARIKELLVRINLWERRSERVESWSRGMKQKLAVMRAILHRPALLFLDEPTAGLDPVASAALREDLESLSKNEGITIFLTTHNLSEAERLCSLVGVINRGKLATVGHPDDLRSRTGGTRLEISGSGFAEPVMSRLRELPGVGSVNADEKHLSLTLSPNTTAAPLVRFLVENGVAVEEVRKGAASLEEAFLAIMQEDNAE